MRVSVRLYKNTGYNLVNRPDGPATLEKLATDYVDVDDIYVVQNVGLSDIRLPLTYEEAKSIDYIRLTSWKTTDPNRKYVYYPSTAEDRVADAEIERVYYVVTGYYQMNNENTCTIPIREDYITTLGINQSDFITGKINAAHVPHNDWKYVRIPETRFSPTGVLETEIFEVDNTLIKPTDNEGTVDIIQSTADLLGTAKSKYADVRTGIIPNIFNVVGEQNTVQVAVPWVEGLIHKTKFILHKIKKGATPTTADVETVEWTPQLYSAFLIRHDNKDVNESELLTLEALRALGLENIIIASYEVPACYVNGNNDDIASESTIKEIGDTNRAISQTICVRLNPQATNIQNSLPASFKFEYADSQYTPRNKKVYCGENNSYVVVSKCTGNSMTFAPEDIIKFVDHNPAYEKPSFLITADLRAEGSPKCMPTYLHNEVNTLMEGIQGMPWGNYQIQYTKQSGTDLLNNQYALDTRAAGASARRNILGKMGSIAMTGAFAGLGAASSLGVGDAMMNWGVNNVGAVTPAKVVGGGQLGNVRQLVGGGAPTWQSKLAEPVFDAGAALSDFRNPYMASPVSAANQAGGLIGNIASGIYAANDWQFQQSQRDYSNALATGTTIPPVISFPYAESNREIYGNYFTMIRYHYTLDMIKQMDAFYDLNGYLIGGIEISSEEDDWLHNRRYFNYISMTDVLLKRQDLSMLERDGLAADLANVRLWHDEKLPKDWVPSDFNEIKGATL